MNQYFDVAEIVILKSISLPEFNGEYVIAGVVTPINNTFYDAHNDANVRYENISSIGYILEDCKSKTPSGNPRSWCQSALRKKHPKGESFEEMMAGLNKTVTA